MSDELEIAARRETLETEAYFANRAWEIARDAVERAREIERTLYTHKHEAECALGRDMGYDWPVQGQLAANDRR